MKQNRSSTMRTYLSIWRQFNKFVISLDVKPVTWEERASLFIAHLIDRGMQSCTVKSYVSAIKRILTDDGYEWNDQKILLNALTKACKLVNDKVQTRLGIQSGLLELILFELDRFFTNKGQTYLNILYKALFALGYYGLLRAGELTHSEHVIKAGDIYVDVKKKRILIVLYSSKTHSQANRPQKIKITATEHPLVKRNVCPFQLINDYLIARGDYDFPNEPLFIFQDGTPVTANNVRAVLKSAISDLGLDSSLYGIHSLRIGHCSDMVKYHWTLADVKLAGRWQSNVVYKYIRS